MPGSKFFSFVDDLEQERERLNHHTNGGSGFLNGGIIMVESSSTSSRSSFPISSPPSSAADGGVCVNGGDGANCILHTVSKFDTLAGVAIKYGVEVADIKKLNGLMTDLQMFALKTLQIPSPGRHPPSPILSNGHDKLRPCSSENSRSIRRNSDLFDSFQSLKLKSSSVRNCSPAISSLLGYQDGGAQFIENATFTDITPVLNPPLSRHRKSKSVANGFGSLKGHLMNPLLTQEPENSDADRAKLLRRRQKSEADFTACTPEKLLKEENISSSTISPITGKSLALRPKSASRLVAGGVDGESVGLNPISTGSSADKVVDNCNGVRKSSSTPSLQDSENCTFSSIWSLKPDFQALSAAAIARPIFDGLPKHMGRKKD